MANRHAAWASDPTRPSVCSPSRYYTRSEFVGHCRERAGSSVRHSELDLHGRTTRHQQLALRLWPAASLPTITLSISRPAHCQASPDCSIFASPDRRVVGVSKNFNLVAGGGLPAAKFSIIAEHIWLLEKTSAPTAFLMFGNDRAVQVRSLTRNGELASSVAFFFLYDDGTLEHLDRPER